MRLVLTDEEKAFVGALAKEGGEYSSSHAYDEFRSKHKDAISTFRDLNLVEHYNQDHEGAYARYRFTEVAYKLLNIPTQASLL